MTIEELLLANDDELISSLDVYQQELVKSLIENTNGNYNVAADKWLSASPSNTFKFGGEKKLSSVFRDKVFEELEKFICGCDEGRYSKERDEIDGHVDTKKETIISIMSAAIGGTIGVAGAYVAPIIVLLLLGIGKVVKNAWCETMKVKRAAETSTAE